MARKVSEMKSPTKKQINLIQKMEQLLNVTFKGNTIAEVSRFISTYMERYQEAQELAFDMVYYHDAY